MTIPDSQYVPIVAEALRVGLPAAQGLLTILLVFRLAGAGICLRMPCFTILLLFTAAQCALWLHPMKWAQSLSFFVLPALWLAASVEAIGQCVWRPPWYRAMVGSAWTWAIALGGFVALCNARDLPFFFSPGIGGAILHFARTWLLATCILALLIFWWHARDRHVLILACSLMIGLMVGLIDGGRTRWILTPLAISGKIGCVLWWHWRLTSQLPTPVSSINLPPSSLVSVGSHPNGHGISGTAPQRRHSMGRFS